jgi:drug/metabolite transporter (DMT)-like permease
MFWFYSILSMIGFALNFVFITKLVRELPTFQSIAYRGFGLAVTMFPFFFFLGNRDLSEAASYLPPILLGSLFTTASLFFFFEGIKLIPLGIGTAIRQSFVVVLLGVLGVLFLGNELQFSHWILIFMIVIGNIAFRVNKEDLEKSDLIHNKRGIVLCLFSGLFGGFGFFFVGKLAQDFGPYVSGYFWELGIGITALIISVIKKEQKKAAFSWKKYIQLLFASSPTILCTFGFTIAVTLGPIGIAGAIQSGAIIIIALLSAVIYKEKLSTKQWLSILFISTAIAAFKLV